MLKNSIFILSKTIHPYSISLLEKFLSANIEARIIEENNSIPKEFYGLNRIKSGPTSWESAFYFIDQNISILNNNYIYFIEDDVYSTEYDMFINLINSLNIFNVDLVSSHIGNRQTDPNWWWWTHRIEDNGFDTEKEYRSFNPICRLSSELVKFLLDYRTHRNKFCFHEILFASVCHKYDLSMLDFKDCASHCIENIRWRPMFEKSQLTNNKIYHPVKQRF